MPVAQMSNDVLGALLVTHSAKRRKKGWDAPSLLYTPLDLSLPPPGCYNCAWPGRGAFWRRPEIVPTQLLLGDERGSELWRKNEVTQNVCDSRIVELVLETEPLILGKLVSV